MEPIGLVVSIVGLAGLFSTCLDVIDKVDAFKDFEADSQPLFSLYEAYKLLFYQWGNQIGILDGELKESHHSALDDPETAAVVSKILLSIRALFDRTELAFPELRHEEKPGFQDKLPQISKKGRLKWAIKGKATFVTRVKEFGNLVQALHHLVPLQGSFQGNENLGLYTKQEHELRDDLNNKALDFSDISRVLADVEDQIEENRRKDLDCWLDASWTTDLFDNFVRRRLDGTCHWMLDRTEFQMWKSNKSYPMPVPKVLWVNGVPGSGKTILCASLIQTLLETHIPLLAYYFISSNTKSREDPFLSIRSWISQIIANNQEARNVAYNRMEGRASTSQTATRKEILDLFESIVELLPGCTLVIDGLDECAWKSEDPSTGDDDSPSSFLKAVRRAISHSSTRLLVVSRDDPEIRDGIYSPDGGVGAVLSEYTISSSDVRADITSFSRNIVNTKLPNKRGDFRETLSDKIADRCDGMFLWVKMLGDELRGGKSQTALEKIVNGTPTALDRLYDKNWDKIRRLSESDKARAINILRWTTFSPRPLTIQELTEALLIQDDGELSMDDFPDAIDKEYIDTEILNICGSLLELRQLKSKQSTVQPVHFSAKQYIMSNLPFQGLIMNGGLAQTRTSFHHSVLAKTCLRHINRHSVWPKELTNEPIPVAFRDYAAGSWYYHFQLAGQGPEDLGREVISFFKPANENWQAWRNFFDQAKIGSRAATIISPTALFYASNLGLLETVKSLIDEDGLDVNYCEATQGTPLHGAAYTGHVEVAKLLLSKGADTSMRSKAGSTAFHIACLNGHLKMASLLLDHITDLSTTDNSLSTPLHLAARTGRVEIVKILLDRGADMTLLDKLGNRPLHAAAACGHVEVVKLFIERSADITYASNGKDTPVVLAASQGHLDVVKILLDHGVGLTDTYLHGWTLLHTASAYGHVEIVKFLLGKGADVTIRSQAGWTGLGLASLYGHLEVVKLLLENATDITEIHARNCDPLVRAAENGHYEVVKLLLEKGALITATDREGLTCLEHAVNRNHIEVAELLLEKGHDINVANDENKWTPVNDAAGNGRVEMVKLLIDKGADIENPTKHGWTPLNNAIVEGHIEVVKLLVEKGADIEALANGMTPLNHAAGRGHIDVVKVLLDKGAKIGASIKGWTPLHNAANEGHTKIVKLLIDKGADIEALTKIGRTPLHYAAGKGHAEIVEVLLEKGADLDPVSALGSTPLIDATAEGYIEVATLLFNAGADVEMKRRKDGTTALTLWAWGGHADLLDAALLREGIDINITDHGGRTPLFYAVVEGRDEIVKRLCNDKRVEIDRKNRYGVTPLSVAARQGYASIAKLLLATKKVNIHSEDCFGRTPLWYARKYKHDQVAQLLVQEMEASGIVEQSSDIPPEVRPRKPGSSERSAAWCDICTTGFSTNNETYHCKICDGGDVDICAECYTAGGRCYESSHELTWATILPE